MVVPTISARNSQGNFVSTRIKCIVSTSVKFVLSLTVFCSGVLVTVHSWCYISLSTWGLALNLRMHTHHPCQDKEPSFSWYRKIFAKDFHFSKQSNISCTDSMHVDAKLSHALQALWRYTKLQMHHSYVYEWCIVNCTWSYFPFENVCT